MATTNKQDAIRERAKDAPPDTYLRVTLGYGDEVILPLEDGLALMKSLSKAERFRDVYSDGRNTPHVGGKLSVITMTLVSGTDYLTGKLNGEAPT